MNSISSLSPPFDFSQLFKTEEKKRLFKGSKMKYFLFSTTIVRIIFMTGKSLVRKTEIEAGVTVQVVSMPLTC